MKGQRGTAPPSARALSPRESPTEVRLPVHRSARAGSSAAPVAFAWWHVGRGDAGPRGLNAGRAVQPVRQGDPPRSPSCAPVLHEGDFVGGSKDAVGRVTGALLRMLEEKK